MDRTKDESKDGKRQERENQPSDFSIFDRDIDEDLKQLDVRERSQSL